MSTPKEKESQVEIPPQKLPNNEKTVSISKRDLFADAIAFFSIITSYFFISFTLHFNIFEAIFGLTLDNQSIIISLFLVYAIFILLLRGISSFLERILKKKGENTIVKLINHQISTSLFKVMLVSALYLAVLALGHEVALEEFCHVAVWLWIAETSRVLGVFLGQATKIDSLSYWGTSIQVILILGGLLEIVDCGIFVLL